MAAENLVSAVEAGDLDELIRLVDRLCAARDWEALAKLRRRCHRAHQHSGRQLWPAAAHAEYRLALEAPGPWAATVLVEGAGRFAPGPLPEVAASSHEWGELAPHLVAGPPAVLTAHERVVRGEDLTGESVPGPPVLDLPLRLQPWEPDYPLASYRAHEADFPAPDPPPVAPVDLPVAPARANDPVGVDALEALVTAWVVGSGGRADAVCVDGSALEAIAVLAPSQARVGPLGASAALAWMGWAGAAGGAHGRRPGAAAGRFAAWWAVAAIGGAAQGEEVEVALADAPDAVGEAAQRLQWLAWDDGATFTGWVLRIAVEDRESGRAWALDAHDAASSSEAGGSDHDDT